MMKTFKLMVGVLAIVALLAPAVSAGTVIKFKQTALDPFAKSGTGVLYLDNDRVRIEYKSGETHQAIIYDRSDKPLLLIVNLNEWSYRSLHEKDIGKIRGKIQDQMDMMDQRLKEMPKEQREQIKGRFAEQIKQANRVIKPRELDKYSYEKLEGGVEVGEYKCDKYKGAYDGEIDHELWIADWEQLGLNGSEFKILDEMVEKFSSFAQSAEFLASIWHNDIAGYPVQAVLYRDGNEQQKVEVTNVSQKDLADDLFKLSKNYDEKDFLAQ